MIQFNLLPDVKIEYIRTRYRKRLIMFISAAVSGVFLFIFIVLLLFVRVNQPRHMTDLERDIEQTANQIKETEDIDQILTIQNQLKSLPGLNDQKVISSRLVDYLTKLTPNQATVSDVNIDFEASTMSIQGNAADLATVNKFVDTLKFTDYEVNEEDGATGKAFSDVVLQSFPVASGQGGSNTASYQIDLVFDPAIFKFVKDVKDGKDEAVTLKVPSIISTRSETEKPSNLFEPQPEPLNGGGQ